MILINEFRFQRKEAKQKKSILDEQIFLLKWFVFMRSKKKRNNTENRFSPFSFLQKKN
jgi:hypothetical protein